jgi:hypothetical protein
MKNDQQGNMGQQQGNQSGQQGKRSQSDLESIIRQGKFGSQSDANSYLQQHGLSCQLRDDGTAEIYEGQDNSNKVATVRFQGSGKDQRGDISSIDY